MKKKKILNILMLLFLLIALGSGGYLAYYYYTNSKTENAIDELKNMIVDVKEEQSREEDDPYHNFVEIDGVYVQKKYEKLYRENPHFMGWIKIKDTNIDYPVMYTSYELDNGEYYIHRDFKEEYSQAGLPFIDSYCNVEPPTDNVIIYGHNMNSGKMFHDLLKYEDKEFYENHKTFEFDSIYGDGTYEVVAIIRSQILPEESTEFKYYEFVNAGSVDVFNDYVKHVKEMSVIDTGVDVTYGEHLLTLSTCAYHVKDGRFAVIAKKIEE